MALILPTVDTEPPEDRTPILTLNHAEMVGVQKWLGMAIENTAEQGKACADMFRKEALLHVTAKRRKAFENELRGFDVVLNYLRAMRKIVDAQLESKSVN